jgi:hypothetical protein
VPALACYKVAFTFLFVFIKSVKPYGAMPWLRMFFVGTLPLRTIADRRTINVRFLVEEVALGQVIYLLITLSNSVFLCQCHPTIVSYSFISTIMILRIVSSRQHR